MSDLEVITWPYAETADKQLDPDRLALIDVDDTPARLRETGKPLATVMLGELMKGADELAVELFLHVEVLPRVGRLLEGADDASWHRVSTGHWQLTLMQRWLPDADAALPPE